MFPIILVNGDVKSIKVVSKQNKAGDLTSQTVTNTDKFSMTYRGDSSDTSDDITYSYNNSDTYTYSYNPTNDSHSSSGSSSSSITYKDSNTSYSNTETSKSSSSGETYTSNGTHKASYNHHDDALGEDIDRKEPTSG